MVVRPCVHWVKFFRECHGAGSRHAIFIEISKDDGNCVCCEFAVEEFCDVFEEVPSWVGVFSVGQHDLLLSVECCWT